jgi:hypothetical protein
MNAINAIAVPVASFTVRQIDEETILLNDDGDTIHILDEIGTFIWRQVDGRKSIEEILELLIGEYEVSRETARTDLVDFLNELEQKRIITLENR